MQPAREDHVGETVAVLSEPPACWAPAPMFRDADRLRLARDDV
jgi:hypothetical protein